MNKKIIPVIIAAIAAMALLLGGCTENPDLAKYTGSTVAEISNITCMMIMPSLSDIPDRRVR